MARPIVPASGKSKNVRLCCSSQKRSDLKFGETRMFQVTFRLEIVFSLHDGARFCPEMLEPVVTVNK